MTTNAPDIPRSAGLTPVTDTSRRTRVVRFLLVGGSSAAIDVGLLVALRELAGLPIPVATTIAFWTALLYNFALNRAWSFGAVGGGTRMAGTALARYLAVVALNYGVTLLIVTGGAAMGVPYAIAKVVAIGVGTLYTYVAYERWVFA